MATLKLKLVEAKELQREIFGFRDENGTVTLKGLLSQDLKAATKFKLVQLGKKIQEKDEAAEEQRKALIEKYGTTTEVEGGQSYKEVVRFKKDKKGNDTQEVTEEYTKFLQEYNELMLTEVSFEVQKLSVSDLDFKTDEVYPFVFEFLVED